MARVPKWVAPSTPAAAAPAAVASSWDEEPATTVQPPTTVRVKCIVHTKPFTDEKWLKHGEEATVPAAVAMLMIERKQVVKV